MIISLFFSKNRRIIYVAFTLFITYILCISNEVYEFPEKKEVLQQVQYLKNVTDTSDSARFHLENLSQHNEEFKLFTYAFTSYSITNLWKKQIIDKELASEIIKNCILNIVHKRIYERYGIEELNVDIEKDNPMSVLYVGHLNLVLGCYKLISNDTTFNSLYFNLSKKLINNYISSKYFNLESYPANIWIPDNAVAISSISLYSKLYDRKADTICKHWLDLLKTKYCDSISLLPYSTIDVQTGSKLEEPRGTMLSWSSMFIYQMNKEISQSIYKNYKKNFSTNYLMFRLFSERKSSWETSMGDIDSGPLLLGFGIPSNVFAMAGAIISNDLITARQIERLINTGTKKIKIKEGQKYELKLFKYNTSPMSESILLFVSSICEWKNV